MKSKRKIIVLAASAILMMSCGGSSTPPSDKTKASSPDGETTEQVTKKKDRVATEVKLLSQDIEDAIINDDLSSINMALDEIQMNKECYTSLTESDKYVNQCKVVVKKYKDRITKLIDKEEDQDVKAEAQKLLKQVLAM